MGKKFVKKIVLIRRCWSALDPPGWALKVTYANYLEHFYFEDVLDALERARCILQAEIPRAARTKPTQNCEAKKSKSAPKQERRKAAKP
jgi:hypothetical protein